MAGLALGCVVTSYCIWYYSGRYVGEMALLLPERSSVRFSVLDFWGNREVGGREDGGQAHGNKEVGGWVGKGGEALRAGGRAGGHMA